MYRLSKMFLCRVTITADSAILCCGNLKYPLSIYELLTGRVLSPTRQRGIFLLCNFQIISVLYCISGSAMCRDRNEAVVSNMATSARKRLRIMFDTEPLDSLFLRCGFSRLIALQKRTPPCFTALQGYPLQRSVLRVLFGSTRRTTENTLFINLPLYFSRRGMTRPYRLF